MSSLSPFDYLKLRTRIDQLVEDGFLIQGEHPNSLKVTRKGIDALMACAERPVPKPAHIHLTVDEREALIKNRHGRTRRKHNPDNLEGKGLEDA
jgi:hypothetical protein